MSVAAETAVRILEKEEGFRPRAYHCSEGYPTIGYGMKLGPKDTALSCYSFKMTHKAAHVWLEDFVDDLETKIRKNMVLGVPYEISDTVRKAVLLSMAYQMGVTRLTYFKKTLSTWQEAKWYIVRHEMLCSKWARQTPQRAERHAEMVESGKLLEHYK